VANCSEQIKIIAMEKRMPDWDRVLTTARGRGYFAFEFDGDIIDLITKIRALLDSPTKCLRILEIDGHGTPLSCNGLDLSTVPIWGQQLMTLAPLGCARGWCEPECSIYLSGCNTGLSHIPMDPNTSVAQQLAEAMRFNPATFNHHITVYGSKGYLSGTNMNGDEVTEREYSEGIWPFSTDHPAKKGASDATGSKCWLPYRNW